MTTARVAGHIAVATLAVVAAWYMLAVAVEAWLERRDRRRARARHPSAVALR